MKLNSNAISFYQDDIKHMTLCSFMYSQIYYFEKQNLRLYVDIKFYKVSRAKIDTKVEMNPKSINKVTKSIIKYYDKFYRVS